jgi:hypothetical protein
LSDNNLAYNIFLWIFHNTDRHNAFQPLKYLILYTFARNCPSEATIDLKVTDKLNGVTLKWTANELQTLENIASKCPFVAGRSVYYARNLLGQDKTWQLIEDDPMCGIIEGQFGKASSTDNPQVGSWTTYPSPTSDAIWLKHDQISTAEFKLFNSQGLIVAEGEVQPARPIMVSHLPDGFYWINIRDKATLIAQTLPIQIIR